MTGTVSGPAWGRFRAALARLGALVLAIAVTAILAGAGMAQDLPKNPILTIDSDRFFADSEFGRRIAATIEAESADLAAENRRIEAELTAEEKDLTARRATTPPEEFRALADAFDAKVQTIRQTQDAKARALTERRDADRVTFLRAAQPVLEDILNETGATVILERNSVFFSSNASDITDRAIAGINASIGSGADPEP
ncbi:MAG: OmpH family outer membrane protein [Marinibacterium sp.]